MPRPPKTWKQAERAVARLLGGRRCHFEGRDVECERFSVEVKHGRQIPRTLLRWFGQARRNAGDGKTPLLALHPLGAAYEDSLVILRLADLLREIRGQVGTLSERSEDTDSVKHPDEDETSGIPFC